MAHVQVPVRVNAWADQGIAPLVKALNRFPSIITDCSCEQEYVKGSEYGEAYVQFWDVAGSQPGNL